MPERRSRVPCPDCGRPVHEKNLQRHYRKMHPGLDPTKRLKDAKGEGPVRRYSFDIQGSPFVPVIVAAVVVALLIIGGLVILGTRDEKHGEAKERNMWYAAPDGAIINGTYYSCGYPGSYTIFLFHDLGQDRHVWDPYARYLRDEARYNVLTIDIRGHGSSHDNIRTSNITYDHRTMNQKDFQDIKNDLVGAKKWVDNRSNTDAGSEGAVVCIGKLGAVIFNQAARMAAQWGIDSSVYVDPVRNAYGVDTFQASEDWGDIRPMLLVSSDGDSETLIALQNILENRPENARKVIVEGSDKGADLFDDTRVRENALTVFQNGFSIAESQHDNKP